MQGNFSQNANDVITTLKSMLKVRTDVELSELLNIKPNTISSWKKRNSLDYDTIISICELYDLDLNALFLRKKSVGVQRNETPFLGRETQFQYASGQDRESLMDLVPKFSFPFLTSENTLAFQVTSNNMFPLLVENSVALCELSDLEEIKDGQVVVLVTHNKGIFVNKLMRNPITKGQFILMSENDFYSNISLVDKEIRECWLVKGVLSYDLNNESRFQYIYDSLKKIDRYFKDKKFTPIDQG